MHPGRLLLIVAGVTSGGCTLDTDGAPETTGAPPVWAVCEPGTVEACPYGGPPGTLGVGSCRAATRTCNSRGDGWSACKGEVLPEPESCATSRDDDCDGEANEGCACIPGTLEQCYPGPEGTLGVGVCAAGTRVCAEDGLAWGACDNAVVPVVEDCVTVDDEDCDGAAPAACTGTPGPPLLLGTPTDDLGIALEVGDDGTAVVAGMAMGTLGSEPTIIDGQAYVARLGPNQSQQWSATFGTLYQPDAVHGIALDGATGDTVIVGSIRSSADFGGGMLTSAGGDDAFVARFTSAGRHVFSKRFGDALNQYGIDAAIGANGTTFVTGYFQGSMTLDAFTLVSAGGIDAFVAALDADGNASWAVSMGDATDQYATRIAVAADGTLWVSGAFNGAIDTASGQLLSSANYDAFLVTLDPDTGAVSTGLRIGGPGDQVATEFKLRETDVVIGGTSAGTLNLPTGDVMSDSLDSWIVTVDPTAPGAPVLWTRIIGGPGDQTLRGVTTDPFGNVVAAGYFTNSLDMGPSGVFTTQGDRDAFVVKLDPDGGPVWAQSFGPGLNQQAMAVRALPDTTILLLGSFYGNIDFGSGPLFGLAYDIFLVRLAP